MRNTLDNQAFLLAVDRACLAMSHLLSGESQEIRNGRERGFALCGTSIPAHPVAGVGEGASGFLFSIKILRPPRMSDKPLEEAPPKGRYVDNIISC